MNTHDPRPRVLLVDDEALLIESLRLTLEAEFEIVAASSVAEAEAVLAARTFDVIMSDHLMPHGTGLEMLVWAREHYPQMKRLMMTGYMQPEMMARAIKMAGLSACVLKPMTPRQVAAEIRAALAR
jgi:DNA-binding NtrC family response regulator